MAPNGPLMAPTAPDGPDCPNGPNGPDGPDGPRWLPIAPKGSRWPSKNFPKNDAIFKWINGLKIVFKNVIYPRPDGKFSQKMT